MRRRRRRRCRNGRRCAALGDTLPGATKAAARCTASNSMRRAAAPAPAASTVTSMPALGEALRRSTTSRASGARSAARVSRSKWGRPVGLALAGRRVVGRVHVGVLDALLASRSVAVAQLSGTSAVQSTPQSGRARWFESVRPSQHQTAAFRCARQRRPHGIPDRAGPS